MYNNLRAKLEGDLTLEEKIMIVDRFKSIFSYHPNISENGGLKTNNGKVLQKIVADRDKSAKNVYEKLHWYDKNAEFPLKGKKYRENMVQSLWQSANLIRRIEQNLFGMTAFYHYTNKEGRWYSMTQMWATNVLAIKGDPNSWVRKIEGNDLLATKNWFWNNLDKSGPHKEILKKTLEKQIDIDGLKLTDENLKELLSWNTIDILDQKVKIKLNLEYVFYLLWECANESIGINLEWIEVSTKIADSESESGGIESETGLDGINENWRRRVIVKGNKHYSSNLTISSVIANAEKDYAKKKFYFMNVLNKAWW